MDSMEKTETLSERAIDQDLEKAKQHKASLIIVRGTPQGKRYELAAACMRLGRDNAVEICIDDTSVSRVHAEVTSKGEVVELRDLGSTNGTFVNGQRIAEAVVLRKEDLISVGSTVLKYLPGGELEIVYLGALAGKAHSDALTGLYNKGYILEALSAETRRALALDKPLGVMVIDIDLFKRINDELGHDVGDTVLKAVGQLLKERADTQGLLIGRFGGEEFLVIAPSLDAVAARELAESLRSRLQKMVVECETARVQITVSIGVALATLGDDASSLFRRADEALYRAKHGGRNKVVIEEVDKDRINSPES
jgi:diguanylate cyclase (GGDEF)-like protein